MDNAPLDQLTEPQDPKTLQELLSKGYSFNFEIVFKKSLELYQENLWWYTAYAAVQSFLFYILGMIPLLGPVACFLLAPYLGAGYFYVINKSFRKEPVEFTNFYSGFKSRYADLFINFAIIAAILAPLGVFSFVFGDMLGFHFAGVGGALSLFLPLITLTVLALLYLPYPTPPV